MDKAAIGSVCRWPGGCVTVERSMCCGFMPFFLSFFLVDISKVKGNFMSN